jgi:hypothetical protein
MNLYKNSSPCRIYCFVRSLAFMNSTNDLISSGIRRLSDAPMIVIIPPMMISCWNVKSRFLKRLFFYLESNTFLSCRKRSNLGLENPSALIARKSTGVFKVVCPEDVQEVMQVEQSHKNVRIDWFL